MEMVVFNFGYFYGMHALSLFWRLVRVVASERYYRALEGGRGWWREEGR